MSTINLFNIYFIINVTLKQKKNIVLLILSYHCIMINIFKNSFKMVSKMHMLNKFYATILENHFNEKIQLKHHKKFPS